MGKVKTKNALYQANSRARQKNNLKQILKELIEIKAILKRLEGGKH